jgi:hypothetical protein
MSLHTKNQIASVVIVTSFFWLGVGLAFDYNADLTRKYFQESLEYGDRVCDPHGGFVSSDHDGDFTCKNGVVIQRN